MDEMTRAYEIASRWKHRTPDRTAWPTISGAIFEEMGVLARALLAMRWDEKLSETDTYVLVGRLQILVHELARRAAGLDKRDGDSQR